MRARAACVGHLAAEVLVKAAGDCVAVKWFHGSAPGWSEAFGLDPVGLVAQFDERLRGGLHERRRAAYVCERCLVRRRHNLAEQLAVDTAAMAGPVGGPL